MHLQVQQGSVRKLTCRNFPRFPGSAKPMADYPLFRGNCVLVSIVKESVALISQYRKFLLEECATVVVILIIAYTYHRLFLYLGILAC